MKIILCDNGLPGLIRFRYDVITHFITKGDDVLLLYPLCTESKEWLSQIPVGARCHAIDFNPSSTSPINDWNYFRRLVSFYKREKPDLCIHYTIKPNIYGTLAAKMIGAKNIAVVAGLGYMFQGSGLVKSIGRSLYKFGLRKANKVVTLNTTIKDVLVSHKFVKRDRIILFSGGEGVNLERYPYYEESYEGTIRFLTVARVFYDKGYKEYTEAADIVHKAYPDVVFEWLGDYDKLSPMTVPEVVINRDMADGRINYLGTTDNVLQYLRRDGVCICLPSHHEGLSKSLMEACSIGLPIIASDIPGCKETVDDGINGFLFPVYDSKALAERMIRFLELSQSEKQKMAKASHLKAVEMFDVKIVLKEYDKVVESMFHKE